MSFFKKLLLGLLAVVLIVWGGAGTQSSNIALQGGGFLSLLVSLVVLYVFTKMAFRVFGFFPALMVLGGIIVFILYAIGAFDNGLGGVGGNIRNFMGSSHQGIALNDDSSSSRPVVEDFPAIDNKASTPSPLEALTTPESPAINFDNLPKVQGIATVVSASKLIINGRYFVLYGLDAPDVGQTCADSKGRAYNCGQTAARWLRSWVNDFAIECRVVSTTSKGSMLGTCSLGEYDIGAALVNAGWAVALTKDTGIYKPYEEQAQKGERGLWQGKFYMPWDWRRLQSRRPNIQIVKPKSDGLFGF